MKKEQVLLIIIFALVLVMIGGFLWFYYQINEVNNSVASVDGIEIMEEEFQNELKSIYGKEVLADLIDKKVIAIAKEKYNIEVDSTEINRQYSEFMKDYDKEEDFLLYIEQQLGLTKEGLLDFIEYNILLEEIATKDIIVSDEEISAYYDRNKFFYSKPENFHIEQIVVNSLDEAEQVVEELNNGSDFNTLAKERSIDVLSASRGGDLGFVDVNDYSVYIEVLEQAKKLDINVLDIVDIPEGYAVIRVLEYNDAIQYTIEDVKEEIRREIALSQSVSIVDVLNQLKTEFNVQVYDSSLK